MKSKAIVTLADSNYYELLIELIDSRQSDKISTLFQCGIIMLTFNLLSDTINFTIY